MLQKDSLKNQRVRLLSCKRKNLLPYGPNQKLQLLFRGVSAERNTEAAVDNSGIYIHLGQNMTAVSLGTGGTGGNTDLRILENVDGVLRGNTRNADIQNVRSLMCAVQNDSVQLLKLLCRNTTKEELELLIGTIREKILPLAR